MATDPFQLYPVIAQIAGAFAGFGSLATGLGQRMGGDDARVDASRLAGMLEASLSATLLGLLPATLDALSVDGGWAVRGSAIAGLVAIAVLAPRGISNVSKIRRAPGFSKISTFANAVCVLTAVVAFILCALGISGGDAAGLYLLGLMALLASSIVMFSRVIVSMLRPHSEAER